MFFGLVAVDDHPCCKMQEAVETFFLNSIETDVFSYTLLPEWFRETLNKATCTLGAKFAQVHALLHAEGVTENDRRSVYVQLQSTNRIQELCDGTFQLPVGRIEWISVLGKGIAALMLSLYDSLDLTVFRRGGNRDEPTHQIYSEFIKKNKYVCPFCGLDKFKNKRGSRREDFDHYLHKSAYPLAASNMKNLVPTCGTCNQDYKGTKDILADGAAFYPYSAIPEVKLEVACQAYPATEDLDDMGQWSVTLELSQPDPSAAPKMTAWNRVYSIKKRLEDEIAEFFEDWMNELTDDQTQPLEREQFIDLIASAKTKAVENSHRRMQPGQIVKAAFFDFMLSRAEGAFVESFRRLQNGRCS